MNRLDKVSNIEDYRAGIEFSITRLEDELEMTVEEGRHHNDAVNAIHRCIGLLKDELEMIDGSKK